MLGWCRTCPISRLGGDPPGTGISSSRTQRIENMFPTSQQRSLVKTGGRLIKHARYYWLLLAEGHLTRRLFGSMTQRMEGLPLPVG